MKNIAKRALGLASALFFVGAMALAASPVQAADVDTRIAALERELSKLKETQEVATEERALAAEMKMPSFKYKPGGGLTIAAADNNWSITFKQRLQTYASYWLSGDNPAAGYNHGVIRVRRFRQSIDMTSQQGFYDVKWQFNAKESAFDGDIYLHFEKMNPFLPTVGYGFNPSFSGNKYQGYGRTEDSLMINAIGLGGSQNRSVVLSWKKLPMMGAVKITHIDLAMGYDQLDEYGRSPAKTAAAENQAVNITTHGDGGWACFPTDPDNASATGTPFTIRPVAADDGADPPVKEVVANGNMIGSECNLIAAGTGEDAEDDANTLTVNELEPQPLTSGTTPNGHLHKITSTGTFESDKAVPGLDSDGKSMAFAIGIQPLAGAGMQGGLNIGSLTYTLGIEQLRDGYPRGKASLYGPTTQERITLLEVPASKGDADYIVHGVGWSPMKWLGFGFNYASYKSTDDGMSGDFNKVNEFRAAAVIWLWGPKDGIMSGSKSAGGISVSPLYTSVNAKMLGGKTADAKAKNNGLAVVYNAPGGWFQVHGVWDNLGCSGVNCKGGYAVADPGKESFNVFTLIAEYKF